MMIGTENHIPQILIVDDDPHLLLTLGEILKVKGFEPLLVQTGGAALTYIEQQPIDVVLIDLKLGDMSGLDVLRGIKASSPESECIMLTGNASQASAIESIQMGAFGYFQKPFDIDQVVLSVQRAVDKYRSTLALRASEEKYRMVADFTYDWEGWRTPDGTYVYISPSCERITGHSAEEFLSDPNLFLEIIHPNDRAMVIEHNDLVARLPNEQDLQIAFRIITASGETRWIEHSCTSVHGYGGQWLGRRESNRDITTRKQAEETQRESEERFRLAFEYTHIGMCLVDLKGQFLKVNPQLCEMFGYSSAQLEGRLVDEITHPDHQKAYPSFLQQSISGDMSHTEFEALYIHKNGSLVWGQVSSSLVQDAAGAPLYFINHIQDVTARKQTERELIITKESLEEANRELQTALVREQKLSHTDSLTGINNRRYLFELAENQIAIASRYQQPLAVMMFDIDHFKQVNDTFGHDVGDQMLRRVAQIACAELRSADVIGRYGGEEFIVLMPMTNAQQACLLGERIRAGVAALHVLSEKGDTSTTLSIGIVEISHAPRSHSKSVEDVFRSADKAMYSAKQAGRNRVVAIPSQ
ncbi:MAG: diguanylate cyclase [Chloroflexi bacterium]|nr:diguanylate cyclase [Chloroflexota bacterium]